MSTKWSLLLVLAGFSLFSCKNDVSPTTKTPPTPPQRFIAHKEFIVDFKSAACVDSVVNKLGFKKLWPLTNEEDWWLVAKPEIKSRHDRGVGSLFVELDSDEANETIAIVNELDEMRNCVEDAIENREVLTQRFEEIDYGHVHPTRPDIACLEQTIDEGGCPNDPMANQQWQLDAINAKDAWKIAYQAKYLHPDHEVQVGVVDTSPNLAESPMFNKSKDGNLLPCPTRSYRHIFSENTDNDHGELVLGSALACSNNAANLVGVDWYSPVTAVESRSAATRIRSMRWLAGIDVCEPETPCDWPQNRSPAYIINTSWVGQSKYKSLLLEVAADVQDASIVIGAAGNDGIDQTQPPSTQDLISISLAPSAIGVGASERFDGNGLRLAEFSNFGPTVNVIAPGAKIPVVTQKNGFELIDGTSYAAPITAAVVAMMKRVNPSLNWPMAKYLLKQTAKPISTDDYCRSEKGATEIERCKKTCADPSNPSQQICTAGHIDAAAAVLAAEKAAQEGGVDVPLVSSNRYLLKRQENAIEIKNSGNEDATISMLPTQNPMIDLRELTLDGQGVVDQNHFVIGANSNIGATLKFAEAYNTEAVVVFNIRSQKNSELIDQLRFYLDFKDAPARMTQISAAKEQTCAISGAGALVCWGGNLYGNLGVGDLTSRYFPTSVKSSKNWSQISSGSSHSCAIDEMGKISCWGSNGFTQLGVPRRTLKNSILPVPMISDKTWLKLSAGEFHNCAIANDSSLWCWGSNYSGQLGTGSRTAFELPPRHVLPTEKFVDIDSGDKHSCGLNVLGQIFCWGRNQDGQLGFLPNHSANSPTQFGKDDLLLVDTRWSTVSTGPVNTCAISDQHRLFCVGSNQFGQLGEKSDNNFYEVMPKGVWRKASVADWHICAIQVDGSLWCWGNNKSGQLGTGVPNQERNPTPAQIKVEKNPEGDLLTWRQVTTGRNHTCAIDESFGAWCWGNNTLGKLGNGGFMGQENLPVMITAAP